MKFEELIMQETQENQKTMALQKEVEQLEEELEEELKLSKVLQYALDGPCCCPCLSTQPHLPFKIKELLTELATVEEEIMWLERKVHKLNLSLYMEKKQTKEWESQQLKNLQYPRQQRSRIKTHRRQQNRLKFMNNSIELQDYDTNKRRFSFGSSTDFKHARLGLTVLETEDISNCADNHTRNPNKLSQDLIKCLIAIFLDLNQPFPDSEEGSDTVQKQISCMNSKSFISKTSFSCTAPTFFFNNSGSNFDPYSILLDFDGATRDIGPYKTFTQITRNTLDHTRVSECVFTTWIALNTRETLIFMNKAVINVGGIVVNALAIEHFILRHPSNSNHGLADEREILLRHAYGLGFPEPNVTFALCRGTWSSPALRVYTADDIVNELARARLEYLDAAVGVISKKKIMVPKLLQWHMKDFADDMESLLEWIYSQLPQSGSLKRLIMECLINGEMKSNPAKMIEIQPYVYEFRYLLPS
ncbi:hypothetical protein E3N88_44648 [Mikania micrantha]|uniref:DUF547 domain-containing protein n=1 Tax=Mikania micrantha TaxID=192012 RepID=A0A5N6LBF3_9ASTR|nr:hypothetical protein E3N88_44648 [Mikania micrantha]